MHHKATIKVVDVPGGTFFASCSCGPQGNFAKKEDAKVYIDLHLSRVGGVNTAEFVDETLPTKPAPATVNTPAPAASQAVRGEGEPKK